MLQTHNAPGLRRTAHFTKLTRENLVTVQKSYIQTMTLSVSKSWKHFLLNKTSRLLIVKSQDLIGPLNFSDPTPPIFFSPSVPDLQEYQKPSIHNTPFTASVLISIVFLHQLYHGSIKILLKITRTLLHGSCTAESNFFLHIPYFTVGNVLGFQHSLHS